MALIAYQAVRRVSCFSVPSLFLCVLCGKPLHFARRVKGLTQRTRRKEEGKENFIFGVARSLSHDLSQFVWTLAHSKTKTHRLKHVLLKTVLLFNPALSFLAIPDRLAVALGPPTRLRDR